MMQFKTQKLSKPGSNDRSSCRVNLLVRGWVAKRTVGIDDASRLKNKNVYNIFILYLESFSFPF